MYKSNCNSGSLCHMSQLLYIKCVDNWISCYTSLKIADKNSAELSMNLEISEIPSNTKLLSLDLDLVVDELTDIIHEHNKVSTSLDGNKKSKLSNFLWICVDKS